MKRRPSPSRALERSPSPVIVHPGSPLAAGHDKQVGHQPQAELAQPAAMLVVPTDFCTATLPAGDDKSEILVARTAAVANHEPMPDYLEAWSKRLSGLEAETKVLHQHRTKLEGRLAKLEYQLVQMHPQVSLCPLQLIQ